MKYLVLDLETSGKITYRRFCNPLDPTHQVDLVGYKYQGEDFKYITLEQIPSVFDIICLDDVSVIVGQNIKFDLLWFWGDKKLQAWLNNGGKVWDTQTVQYLLDGQRRISRSLDDLALKYGGTVKDFNMKEFYKNGGQSKDAPFDVLLGYNKEDVLNTNLILQAQIKLARQKNMLPLIETYMEHYLAVIEMEYNGIFINNNDLKTKVMVLIDERDYLLKNLQYFAKLHGWESFNPLSLDELSLFLFGGISKIREKRPQFDEMGFPIIVKCTGLQKEKYEILSIESKGVLNAKDYKGLSKNKKGYYFLKDEDLTYIIEAYPVSKEGEFCFNILEYRKLVKKISTYYEGLLECLSPYTGCVHPEFKTAFTDTGRLSSINPNAQNLLPEVLDYVTSRYKDEGKIVEIDFSQLEVRLQAYITGCYEFSQDIINGIDFHTLRLSYAEGLSYEETLKRVHSEHEWALKRKNAKTISFQKAYGAAPAKIAEETGIDEKTIRHIFEQEDLRYPEIKGFYESIVENCTKNKIVTAGLQVIRNKSTGLEFTKDGEQAAHSVYKSITQKEYIFNESAVLTKTGKIFRYFNMPKIQNSPVQGIAADFVDCQIGQFYRWLKKNTSKCWMIDEVHDSIILDCHVDELTNVIKYAKIILENTEKFEELAGKDFNIPMLVDIKIGNTWGEIKQND
jgi:DNA polymerase I-like protein with 3'-5' exonuclease and polymerase domains